MRFCLGVFAALYHATIGLEMRGNEKVVVFRNEAQLGSYVRATNFYTNMNWDYLHCLVDR